MLSLNVAPIQLNLLGMVLQTDRIKVNADVLTGSGELLGNLLNDLLDTRDATPRNLTDLNDEVNNLLSKVVDGLTPTTPTLSVDTLDSLSRTFQTPALLNLVITTGASATAPVPNLDIASTTDGAPPVDVNLLGRMVTVSNIHA